MTLSEKLKQARLEAGLSQRQLCGNEITRNMLSQIENGSARPSMTTLQYLAQRLGKPIGYFLDEAAVTSPNQALMEKARLSYGAADPAGVLKLLEDYRSPDPVFDPEAGLLNFLAKLALAQQALQEHRPYYAEQLLEECCRYSSLYITPPLQAMRTVLFSQTPADHQSEAASLSLDTALTAKAAAFLEGDPLRCSRLLLACDDTDAPQWNLLMGTAQMKLGQYADAAAYLHRAEPALPEQTAPLLEICYREQRLFEKAYFYACKQK